MESGSHDLLVKYRELLDIDAELLNAIYRTLDHVDLLVQVGARLFLQLDV